MELETTTTTASDQQQQQRKRKWVSEAVVNASKQHQHQHQHQQEEESEDEAAATERPAFPVTKVVLSKTGIGYFEREDEVASGRPFELYFKSGDMNDVLKSLTMIDISGRPDIKKAKKDVGAEEPVVGGGTNLVSSISYESTRPFEKQLDDLSISLNEHSTLRDLLGQVKGTPVRVEVLRRGKSEFVEGTVIGLERKQVVSPSFHEAHFLALLVGGKAVQYYNLNAVVKLRFANELVRQDLRHLLAVLLLAKKKDMKSVTGYTRGDGEASTIRASYIVEAPVWKATYRLFFNNQRRASTEPDAELPQPAQSIVEGWALVDNTQNEDWRGVELSLVSGASNSFIYDLYKPRYAARTEIVVESEETLAPPTLEDAIAQRDLSALTEATAVRDQRERTRVVRGRANQKAKKRSRAVEAEEEEEEDDDECEMEMAEDDSDLVAGSMNMQMQMQQFTPYAYGGMAHALMTNLASYVLVSHLSAAATAASAVHVLEVITHMRRFARATASSSVEVNVEAKKMEMADLFQYKITSAVNVTRNQSALVPFLHTEFKGVKASVYNKNVRDDHPLAVIKFKNTFGVPLESGPLCLFEDDVYVGESMLPRVKVNEEVHMAYAVDLKTTVTMTEASTLHDPHQVDAGQRDEERGKLYLRRWRVYEFTYVVDNKNDHAIEHFYLEHSKRASELVDTAEPDERLGHLYRFKLVAPTGLVKFIVKEREAVREEYLLASLDAKQVENWAAEGYIPAAVKRTFDQIVGLCEKVTELQGNLNKVVGTVASLKEDVARIKRCLDSLAQGKHYAREQNEARDFFTKRLNAARTEQTAAKKEQKSLEGKRDRSITKTTTLANSISFLKKL